MPMQSSKRKWYHLHQSTLWIAGTILAAVVCLVFPGEGFSGSGGHVVSWNDYVHGWPWIFERRTVFEDPVKFGWHELQIPWLTPSCWMLFRGDEIEFTPGALAADTLVALAITCAVAMVLEVRRRKVRSIYQIRLADLLVVGLIVFGIFAWWKMQNDDLARQQMHSSAVEQRGHRVYGGGYGPAWIRRLIGMDLEILPSFDEVELCSCSEEELAAILPDLELLRDLQTMRIVETDPGDTKYFPLSKLRSLKNLRDMDLSATPSLGHR